MPRRVPVFFYGLFMDADLLREQGVEPTDWRLASLRGFSIRIGARATLVPNERGVVYGMLIDLTHGEIETLYSAPGLRPYQPEAVLCELEGDARIAALCYTLPEPPAPGERNPDYADRLRALGRRLGLPAAYVDGIE
ncbi:MAG TPA: gamma-glutamylcyclotransferase family protein [Vicinamibacterales bacterium]|nr:gamma-glutamylcyclotransferase family protein [Vicinamibacterales bacterium]